MMKMKAALNAQYATTLRRQYDSNKLGMPLFY
jgi:hypothetical protein